MITFKNINYASILRKMCSEGTINILCVLWGLELRLACALITLNGYNGELYG